MTFISVFVVLVVLAFIIGPYTVQVPRALVSPTQVFLVDGYVLAERQSLPADLTDLDLRQWERYVPVSRHAAKSKCVADSAVMWLLNQRMTDYGYSATDWNRIRAQRTRARKAMSLATLKGSVNLAWGCSERFMVRFSDGQFDYQVGQSENEELTNLMRRLVNPTAGWMS